MSSDSSSVARYSPIFSSFSDAPAYTSLGNLGVEVEEWDGQEVLWVTPEAVEELVHCAFTDMAFLFRQDHLQGWARILQDPQASDNDRYVATELLRNAVIASQRVFPSCQDTGTAIVMGWKGERVWLRSSEAYTGITSLDKEAISRGVYRTYQQHNLRYSQMAPLSLLEEKNTGSNLPAQIHLSAEPGRTYRFLCVAKGGGSANKTFLYQKSKAVLQKKVLHGFLKEVLLSLGTAACPPYHLAVVIGGLSAEHNLHTVKLASCRYYDSLPTAGNDQGQAFRVPELEQEILTMCVELGIGAQFGGTHFAQSVRVIRLPRHAASCVIGVGVSCSADRQILGKITAKGVFLETLESDPTKYLPQNLPHLHQPVSIRLDRPLQEVCADLSRLNIGDRIMLTGPMVVARDIAHAKIQQLLKDTGSLPEYMRQYAVYYAGPAKTPTGHASGSFGPTTSQRMDPYVPSFQEAGGSLIMLGKGNRSSSVRQSCQQHGGFYLGSIGGPAARLGKECIEKVEVLDYKELGMEAVWKIWVKDFPAFVITDDKGGDFFLRP